MENFFSLDGKFFRFINKFTSLIALNFLFIITSLPIITIGVSFYALYQTNLKLSQNTESYIARTYFFFSALSYPFIGLFNGGAALFRSMGNSKVAMTNSFYMNIGNIVLNYLFIFILNMSVKGAAIATLLSRMFCSFIIFS